MDMKNYNQAMIATYSRRTAVESSAYMLPLIQPHMRILDVGCGPGTITLDLAALVPEGSVDGIDASDSAIENAQALCKQRGIANATFVVGDIAKLPFNDDSFDIVHAHQVLIHLPGQHGEPGPVWGLKEMRRVCKPGGFVCAREAEWSSIVIYPRIHGVKESLDVLSRLADHSGKIIAGGRGREFARRAGFSPEAITASAACVTYTNSADRAWAGQNMAFRFDAAADLRKGVELGFVTEEEATRMPAAWREWAEAEDGFYSMLHGQIVCTK
ncbi:methyltransferase type 11 [Xylaria bambusicola]|uniref:methyltransferase type 11 n=1 Tax=Xylaria bambusicola TaxID=326684 RepID=UPI002007D66E|nr:methyltransferase type 11 [Xylaria bambusicola]KAI0522143.1 methyltransferase type 11 [Xylaria bambusicola]